MPLAGAGLARALIPVLVLALGAGVAAPAFQPEIGPLLAALGVAALPVALAFAGHASESLRG